MAALNSQAGYWDIWWPRILQGLGLGFMFVPLTVATLADIPLANMSDATGILTLVRYLGETSASRCCKSYKCGARRRHRKRCAAV